MALVNLFNRGSNALDRALHLALLTEWDPERLLRDVQTLLRYGANPDKKLKDPTKRERGRATAIGSARCSASPNGMSAIPILIAHTKNPLLHLQHLQHAIGSTEFEALSDTFIDFFRTQENHKNYPDAFSKYEKILEETLAGTDTGKICVANAALERVADIKASDLERQARQIRDFAVQACPPKLTSIS